MYRRMKGWKVNNNLEGRESWPNLICYPSIRLEGLRKTTKELRRDSRSPGWHLKSGPP
jgi:hypothetical protein